MKIRRIVLLSVILGWTGSAAATGETPLALLAAVPALPTAVDGARCDAAQGVIGKAQAAAQADMLRAQQLAMQPPRGGRISDAQGAAIERLSDPQFTGCMMEVTRQLAEDLAPLEQSLYVELEELAEAKRRDKKLCGPSGKGADIDCFARVEAVYPEKARAAANAFLGRAGAQYGALSERTRACLSRRETAIEGVQRSGLSGMFGMQAIASRAENWRMPAMLAETYGNLCGKAVDAAGRFGPPR